MKITVARKGQLFLIVSFAALVATGTLLLLLPGMLKEGSLSFIDALFMACSATCLNGLATVPVKEFSFAGQFIILVLIQLGTLGILSLSAMLLLVIGKGLSFSSLSSKRLLSFHLFSEEALHPNKREKHPSHYNKGKTFLQNTTDPYKKQRQEPQSPPFYSLRDGIKGIDY